MNNHPDTLQMESFIARRPDTESVANFKPSEEISEDSPVPFPVDI